MKYQHKIRSYKQKDGIQSFLPFYLPPGKSGKVEVKVEVRQAGERMTVVSLRNAIFMGMKPAHVLLKHDTLVHTLTGKEGVWMTTRPQEIEQSQRQLRNAHGRVLVGGLGLGLSVALLEQNPKVKWITVIENNLNVIKLVRPYLVRSKTVILHDDLMEFLKAVKRLSLKGYDFAFYDIWQSTGQFSLTKIVMPLRKASLGIIPQDQIECWNEDEMIGQVSSGIMTRLQFEYENNGVLPIPRISEMSVKTFEEAGKCNQESWPFWRWFRKKPVSKAWATQMAEQYCLDLKDAERYKRWKGKQNELEEVAKNN